MKGMGTGNCQPKEVVKTINLTYQMLRKLSSWQLLYTSETNLSPLLNLLISITWSLFSLLAALVRHLSSPSLVYPHLPLSKSQIALSVMHHSVFGIIFMPHSVNLVHHLSPSSHHPSLPLSSIPPVPQILPTIDPLLPTGLSTGLQPDCLHGLRTTLRYVLVLPLSSFSRRVCRTKLAFS